MYINREKSLLPFCVGLWLYSSSFKCDGKLLMLYFSFLMSRNLSRTLMFVTPWFLPCVIALISIFKSWVMYAFGLVFRISFFQEWTKSRSSFDTKRAIIGCVLLLFFPNRWTAWNLISPVSIPTSSKTLRTFSLQFLFSLSGIWLRIKFSLLMYYSKLTWFYFPSSTP